MDVCARIGKKRMLGSACHVLLQISQAFCLITPGLLNGLLITFSAYNLHILLEIYKNENF